MSSIAGLRIPPGAESAPLAPSASLAVPFFEMALRLHGAKMPTEKPAGCFNIMITVKPATIVDFVRCAIALHKVRGTEMSSAPKIGGPTMVLSGLHCFAQAMGNI